MFLLFTNITVGVFSESDFAKLLLKFLNFLLKQLFVWLYQLQLLIEQNVFFVFINFFVSGFDLSGRDGFLELKSAPRLLHSLQDRLSWSFRIRRWFWVGPWFRHFQVVHSHLTLMAWRLFLKYLVHKIGHLLLPRRLFPRRFLRRLNFLYLNFTWTYLRHVCKRLQRWGLHRWCLLTYPQRRGARCQRLYLSLHLGKLRFKFISQLLPLRFFTFPFLHQQI